MTEDDGDWAEADEESDRLEFEGQHAFKGNTSQEPPVDE